VAEGTQDIADRPQIKNQPPVLFWVLFWAERRLFTFVMLRNEGLLCFYNFL